MGYPMNYGRVIGRNKLDGDYDPAEHTGLGLIRGDLRRMEKDQQDDAHVAAYARRAGTTFAQAKQILADVFSDQDVLWQPAPNNPEVAAAPEGVTIKLELLDFLSGIAALDGVWFGDEHPKYMGKYWWRRYLPDAPQDESPPPMKQRRQ